MLTSFNVVNIYFDNGTKHTNALITDFFKF